MKIRTEKKLQKKSKTDKKLAENADSSAEQEYYHDSDHMTVSHKILKSQDLDITRSYLWSDSELASDSCSLKMKNITVYITELLSSRR